MKNRKPEIAIILSVATLLLGVFVFFQTEMGQEILHPIPDGYAAAQTGDTRFLYPSEDLVFTGEGFWTREMYDRKDTAQSDTMPFIRVESVEKNSRSLEEVAIAEQGLGTGEDSKISETSFGQHLSESFGYGYKTVGGKNILWVHAHEKFDTTTYYFEQGEHVVIFEMLSTNEENIALVESMIESAKPSPSRGL